MRRYGEIRRLTRDHTLPQLMLDDSRITQDYLTSHPRLRLRRSMLLKLLALLRER